MRLAEAINEAMGRCNAGGGSFELPGDFDCYPVLTIDSFGKCSGVECWQASIGDHVSKGASPELAVFGICRGPVTP